MPTSRPRITITETDEVVRELDRAAKRWPELDGHRGALLMCLARLGAETLAVDDQRATERRRAAVTETSGTLAGCYEPAYLEDLRREWPG